MARRAKQPNNAEPLPAHDREHMEQFIVVSAMTIPEDAGKLAEHVTGYQFANEALGNLFDFVVSNSDRAPIEIVTTASQQGLLAPLGGIAGYGKMQLGVAEVDLGIASHYAKKLGDVPIEALSKELEHEFIWACVAELRTESRRNDIANAERFIDRYHRELLYVPQWKRWLSWDGMRWVDDCNVGAMQRAEAYAKSLWSCLARMSDAKAKELQPIIAFIRATNQLSKMRSFMELASCDERVVCRVEELNADPVLFNCPNGTIDLTTGRIRPHSPADRITQLSKVMFDPKATCPKWLEALELIFAGDQELVRFVQQLLGYSMSGETGEHILPIAYGSGANGKSTIWNCVSSMLGDYAALANDSLLMGDKHGHPTEKAALYQKRFVPISEPEKGAALKESRVKELTGDRTITARRMHEDFWSFERTHTFWLSTNHLPRINGTDEGVWRRVKLLPFRVDLRKVTKPIPDFDQWLAQHEGSGILNWLLAGYLDYRANGLLEPKVVTDATSHYREDSDPLGEFLKDCCEIDTKAEEQATKIFEAYQAWGGRWTKTAFGRAMAEKFVKERCISGPNRFRIIYRGVRIASTETAENTEDLELCRVVHSPAYCPGESGISLGGPGKLCTTMHKPGPPCEKCGGETALAAEIGGYRNADCLACGAVKPIRCEVAE